MTQSHLVSIVIPCHSYGRFLKQAIDSALAQSVGCEVIVVDDASTDDTQYVASRYPEIRYMRLEAKGGVSRASNYGIQRATGQFVMRLDADDYLHPDCALILSTHLRNNPEIVGVFSDYVSVDVNGNKISVVDQPKPIHPGCLLLRRENVLVAGGYDEELPYQEGYDLILRLERQGFSHVSLPLWFYRSHGNQMSTEFNARMLVRQGIKERHEPAPKVLTVIPARGNSKGIKRKNLRKVNGVTLIQRAIMVAKNSGHEMQIVVSTEDEEIAELAGTEGVAVHKRPAKLSEDDVSLIPVAIDAMDEFKNSGWPPDIVVTIQPTSPFTPSTALDKGLIKIRDKGIDSVVSVAHVRGTHPYRAYRMGEKSKLEPFMGSDSERYLQRQDRPAAYGFTGGFYIRKAHLLDKWSGNDFALGKNVYGIEVPDYAGIDIDDILDLWTAEQIAKHWSELKAYEVLD